MGRSSRRRLLRLPQGHTSRTNGPLIQLELDLLFKRGSPQGQFLPMTPRICSKKLLRLRVRWQREIFYNRLRLLKAIILGDCCMVVVLLRDLGSGGVPLLLNPGQLPYLSAMPPQIVASFNPLLSLLPPRITRCLCLGIRQELGKQLMLQPHLYPFAMPLAPHSKPQL